MSKTEHSHHNLTLIALKHCMRQTGSDSQSSAEDNNITDICGGKPKVQAVGPTPRLGLPLVSLR